MAVNYKKVWKGFKIVAKALSESDSLGDMEVLTTDNKLHYHNGTTSSPIVTETHSASLINKELVDTSVTFVDSVDPTIQVKIDAAGTAGTSTTLQSSQTVDRTLILPNVNGTLATTAQVDQKVTGPASATGRAIARFDGTTGKLIQNSLVEISDTGIIVPTVFDADLRVQGNFTGKVNIGGFAGVNTTGRESNPFTNADPDTASNTELSPAKHFRIGDDVVGPLDTITPYLGSNISIINGMEITLHKVGVNPLIINNMSGTPPELQIKTGSSLPITFRPGDSLHLVYNGTDQHWQVVGSQFKNSTNSVDNTLVRFDGTSGHIIQESNVVLNDAEEMSGLTKLKVDNVITDGNSVFTNSGNLELSAGFQIVLNTDTVIQKSIAYQVTIDSTTTGANATLPVPATKHIQLTNVGLTSIDMIGSSGEAQEIILQNMLTTPITINNNTGATPYLRVLTGTGGAIKLAPQASLYLVYDFNNWRVVGGTGGSATITKLAGETIAVNDLVYTSTGTGADSGRFAGYVYKVDPTNDARIETIGFAANSAILGGTVDIIVGGIIDSLSGLSINTRYFADPTTPGAITNVEPSVGGQYIIPVGVSVGTSELLISQVPDIQQVNDYDFTIANNQVAAANVTGLVFTGRSFHIDYAIYRQTDTALSGVAQSGQLRGVYNTQSSTWLMSDDYSGQNAGVNFSVTSGGQIQYTSTNIAGANYIGQLSYNVRKQF